MAEAHLNISLGNLRENYKALDAKSSAAVETAGVVKADAYGLGAEKAAQSLLVAGARSFFVATTEEAMRLRSALPQGVKIYVFGGLLPQDASGFDAHDYIPMLNSVEQVKTYIHHANKTGFGLQLDTGMNRLGLEDDELRASLDLLGDEKPDLVISHLACADEPAHPQNAAQLAEFKRMTDGMGWRRSLAATGGTLLGADYHFDLTRPGIGLYGGSPFEAGLPVIFLDIPVIQTREVKKGEAVGYGASWVAPRDSRVATISAGYADGLNRAMGNGKVKLYAGSTACPLIGRVSMDLLTVDVTDLEEVPAHLSLLNVEQTVDDLAEAAGTIGYEFLTSLGGRYARKYQG